MFQNFRIFTISLKLIFYRYTASIEIKYQNCGKFLLSPQKLEVLSLSHLYSLKTKSIQCHYVCSNDIMRFSVLGITSDIRIELHAPVLSLRTFTILLFIGIIA